MNISKPSKKNQDTLNIPKQTINKMFNGTRMVSAQELSKIANYFDVSVDSIVQKKHRLFLL